jgi:hypothetical protein
LTGGVFYVTIAQNEYFAQLRGEFTIQLLPLIGFTVSLHKLAICQFPLDADIQEYHFLPFEAPFYVTN